jgi:uncharacterized caspase-like protein
MYKLLPILLFAYGLAVTTNDIYDNSYALIIGIDKYENVQPLNYAVKDAESIQDILVNTFDFPEGNITLLKNEEATKQSIIQAFSDITTKAEDKDRVLIYFAGHGDTDDLPEGGEMGYLLPVDGDNENLFVTSIAMDDLKRISLMSKAKHLLYLVDACYGGLLTIGSRGIDPQTTSNYIDKITEDKARQIITAGGRDEEVMEKSEWGHSAFTKNLIRALKDGKADYSEDGIITAAELGIYLNEKVTIDSENQQTPQYGRMTSQEGEFVFVYSENTAVIQDKSTDAKLDYLISEMEELKTQSTVDKNTKLDLKVEPALQQSNYPSIYSFVYVDKYLLLTLRAQLEKRAFIGIGLGNKNVQGEGGVIDVNEFGIRGFLGYYLTPRNTKIFNPHISFGASVNFEKWKAKTLNLYDTGRELNFFLQLHNDIILSKSESLTFGLTAMRHGIQDFNEYGDLYIKRYDFDVYPFFTYNYIPQNITYETLSNSDKIKYIRERKKNDLISFSIWYAAPIIGNYWLDDGITLPTLLIPAIGPLLTLSEVRGYENITLLAGVLQSYHLFDYIITSKKLKGLNNNISYQINPNPIAPSVKFTYDFD